MTNAAEEQFSRSIEIFGEPGAELCASAEEHALYSRHREIQDLGNLLIAELLVSAQHERHPLRLRQALNRFLNRLLQFRLEQRCVRRESCFILERRILRAGF